jgi:hypothetical protein
MPAVTHAALAAAAQARHTDQSSSTGFRNSFKDLVSWRAQHDEEKRIGVSPNAEAAAQKALAKAETFVDVSAVGLTRIQRTWSVAPEYASKGGPLQGAAEKSFPSAPSLQTMQHYSQVMDSPPREARGLAVNVDRARAAGLRDARGALKPSSKEAEENQAEETVGSWALSARRALGTRVTPAPPVRERFAESMPHLGDALHREVKAIADLQTTLGSPAGKSPKSEMAQTSPKFFGATMQAARSPTGSRAAARLRPSEAARKKKSSRLRSKHIVQDAPVSSLSSFQRVGLRPRCMGVFEARRGLRSVNLKKWSCEFRSAESVYQR